MIYFITLFAKFKILFLSARPFVPPFIRLVMLVALSLSARALRLFIFQNQQADLTHASALLVNKSGSEIKSKPMLLPQFA